MLPTEYSNASEIRGTMSSSTSKDVEMKDTEEEKPKEAEEDPKQTQKDKDLLTFEGRAAILLRSGGH